MGWLLGRKWLFSSGVYIYRSDFFDEVSAFEILTDKNRELPRSPFVLEVELNGESYIVINNHLKCCGDGYLDHDDLWDEEKRRYDACILIDQYIVDNYPDSKVFFIGDLNDLIQESSSNNVFEIFIDNPEDYYFTDMPIAQGTSSNWSYPSWPSHLDHILITNELFDDFGDDVSVIETIRVDDYFEEGFSEYDEYVSDHRPVGIKLPYDQTTNIEFVNITNKLLINNYPNPVLDKTTIILSPNKDNVKVVIEDIQGKVVFIEYLSENQNSIEWQTNNHGGIYIAKLFNKNQIIGYRKIVVVN